MQSAYDSWIGQAVVLQVAVAYLRAPVRGVIVGESGNDVLFRIGKGWNLKISKSMILAIEEDDQTC